jgi:hypothetical protein
MSDKTFARSGTAFHASSSPSSMIVSGIDICARCDAFCGSFCEQKSADTMQRLIAHVDEELHNVEDILDLRDRLLIVALLQGALDLANDLTWNRKQN